MSAKDHSADAARTRVTRFWVPVLATLTVAMVFLQVQIALGILPLMFFPNWDHPWNFYLPWLAVLPFVGAFGVWLSGRAGGTARQQQLAGLGPVLGLAAFMVVALVPELIIDTPRHGIAHTLHGVAWYLVCWLLAPGLMLGLGVMGGMRLRGWTNATSA